MALPTGLVVALGTVVGTPGSYAGSALYVKDKLFDNSTSTFWVPPDPGSGHAGLDLGVAAVLRRVGIVPRESEPAQYHEQFTTTNTVISGSNTGIDAGLTTLKTLTPADLEFRRHYYRYVTIAGGVAYRYVRVANTSYGNIAETEYIVEPTTGLSCKPLAPTISPGTVRKQSATPVPVTIASDTTSAQIYYTIDGTTPNPGGGGDTSQIYTGPFDVIPTAAGVTIMAVAYDSNCSTPTSRVTTAVVYLKNLVASDVWYDTENKTIEAHAPCMFRDPVSGNLYLYGHFSDQQNNGGLDPCCPLVYGYRSIDGGVTNWRCLGPMVGREGLAYNSSFLVRPNVAYRPSTGKYVMWAKQGAGTSALSIWTADSPEGPWTNFGTGLTCFTGGHTVSDFSFFTDDDGSLYIVASAYDGGSVGHILIRKVSDAGTGCTGSQVEVLGGSGREAPVMFKVGSNYFLITSKTNYYDSVSDTFDSKYVVGTGGTTPLNATWPNLSTGASIWASAPTANTTYNAQPANVFAMPGYGLVLMMDWWSPTYNFNSKYVWVKLSVSGTTLVAAASDTAPTASGKNNLALVA